NGFTSLMSLKDVWWIILIWLKFGTLALESPYEEWRGRGWHYAWDTLWHYKQGDIGSPKHWGIDTMNPDALDAWKTCSKGKHQSPIDIRVDQLLFDPQLTNIKFRGLNSRVRSLSPVTQLYNEIPTNFPFLILINFAASHRHTFCHQTDAPHHNKVFISSSRLKLRLTLFNAGQNLLTRVEPISTYTDLLVYGGPLSYQYRIFGFILKFGSLNAHGSEHRINNHSFPGE
ncbi:Carbonic anhydrase- protein 10, partial [Cichlidogyrus casuarinus]